jgi:hypothetical protein
MEEVDSTLAFMDDIIMCRGVLCAKEEQPRNRCGKVLVGVSLLGHRLSAAGVLLLPSHLAAE